MKTLLCFALWVGLALGLRSQHSVLRHFTVEDGLCSSEIYDLHQDSLGRIWMATSSGLCVYDGQAFQSFSFEDGVSENDILKIFSDSQGRIWFTTYTGLLNMYDGRQIYSGENSAFFKKIPRNRVHLCFVEDTVRQNMYWGASQITGIDWKKQKSWVSTSDKINGRIVYLELLPNGDLLSWHSYGHGYLSQNSRIIHSRISWQERLRHMIRLQDGTRLQVWENQVCILEGSDSTCYPLDSIFPEKVVVLGINELWDGRVAFSTTRGSWVFSLPHIFEGDLFAQEYEVSRTLLDRDSMLWFGTLNNGLLAGGNEEMQSYTHKEGLGEVFSLYQRKDGSIWGGGSSSRVYRIKGKDLKILDFPTKLDKADRKNRVLAFHESQNDSFYIGGDGGLFIMKDNEVKYEYFPAVKCLGPDLENGFLIGNPSLWLYQSQKVSRNPNNQRPFIQEQILFNIRVSEISQDPQGRYWVASGTGLLRWDNEKALLDQTILPDTLISGSFNAVKTDLAGNVWATSDGRGLVIFPKGQDSLVIQKAQGLSSNLCTSLALDSQGIAWVGSKSGLNRVQYLPLNQQVKIQRLGISDGLSANEINDLLVKDDTVWVATSEGLTRFRESAWQTKRRPPQIWLGQARLNGKVLPHSDSLTLSHAKDQLDLQFKIASPNDLGPPRYVYRIPGLTDNWLPASGSGITFNSLPPGKYTLQVKAQTERGLWTANTLEIPISVPRPWWRSPWTFAAGGAILLGLGLFIGFLNNRVQKRRRDLQVKVLLAEQKALRAQMNPHFLFNALNAIQKFFLKHQAQEGNRYLNKFSVMIRKILENSDRMYVPIDEELELLQLYLEFERLRSGDGFEYHISVSDEIDSALREIPSMLLQPLLENAIWHGLRHKEGKGRLDLRFYIKQGILIAEVEDNGVGRKVAEEMKSNFRSSHRSMGLKLIRERITTINHLKSYKLKLLIEDKLDPKGKPAGTLARLNIFI